MQYANKQTVYLSLCVTTLALFAVQPTVTGSPGNHLTLACTDCHLVEPDPQIDTIDTVTFVNADREGLCFGCHEDMHYLIVVNSPVNYRHTSFGILPSAMLDHYQDWLADHPEYQDFPIEIYSDGSFGCISCHPFSNGLYTDIPMTNLELCVACHASK